MLRGEAAVGPRVVIIGAGRVGRPARAHRVTGQGVARVDLAPRLGAAEGEGEPGRRRMQQDCGLQHVVLASDCDAFNLGGDLEYFCDSIRRQDRNALLTYARQCGRGVHAFHTGLDAGGPRIALGPG